MEEFCEKIFHLKENHTSMRTEIVSGITTFMTMAYILIVNPSILSATGMDKGALLTVTAIASALGTFFMAAFCQLSLCPGTGHGIERLLCLHRLPADGEQLGNGPVGRIH